MLPLVSFIQVAAHGRGEFIFRNVKRDIKSNTGTTHCDSPRVRDQELLPIDSYSACQVLRFSDLAAYVYPYETHIYLSLSIVSGKVYIPSFIVSVLRITQGR